MKAKEALQRYKESSDRRKAEIKADPRRGKRFWKWCWFLISWPFRWLWAECHDWRFLVLFIGVAAVMSVEVWGFYLAGLVTWGTEFSKWAFGVASACWLFWLGPFTPFVPLCMAITCGIKTAIDRARERKERKAKEADR